MYAFFLILITSFPTYISHSCFEDVPMAVEAHFGGLKPFTDLYATQPKIFLYKPAYHKRMLGTKAQEHTPLRLYLTDITADSSQTFMGARLETLHRSLTNSHLKTRQVESVEIDFSVREGKEAVLKSMREIYNLIRILQNEETFPYTEIVDRTSLPSQYPGIITFNFNSVEDPRFIERFYKPNAQRFSVSDILALPGSSGKGGEKRYQVVFYAGFGSKFDSAFVDPFEKYVDLPSEVPAQNSLAAKKKEEPTVNKVPAGGVPIHPGREGFTHPVDFLPDKSKAAVDQRTSESKVSKLARQMEDKKFSQ